MLVLTRKLGENIRIGDAVKITVLEVRSGQVVTTIRSSADGRFRIKLPAGQYELQVLRPTDRSASGPPQLVVVQPHAFSQATLQFDTGIR